MASSSADNRSQDELLDALITRMLSRPDLTQRLRGPQGDQGPPGRDGQAGQPAAGQAADTRWRIEEFGLFEPDLQVDDRNPPGDVITVGKDSVYRNVDAFCERIKDAISTKGPEAVRDNLHLCLRGAASRWWTFEVAEVDKLSIRGDNSAELLQWTMRLQTRFRPRMAQAVRENSELTFKVSDIRSGKRVLAYFQSKILRARAAGFGSVQGQLIQVYSGMDVQLRLHLYEPTAQTTLAEYRELLMEKEENWIEAYKPRPQFSPQHFPQNRPYLQNAGYNVVRQQLPYNVRTPSPTQQYTPSRAGYNAPYPNQQYSNPYNSPRSTTPCPIHAARGETYYHPASTCRLRFSQAQPPPARQAPTAPPNRQIAPSQPSGPIIELINFQEQDHSYGPQDNYHQNRDPGPYGPGETDDFYGSDDYNAYGAENFHGEFDLGPQGPGETEYPGGNQTSGYFVQGGLNLGSLRDPGETEDPANDLFLPQEGPNLGPLRDPGETGSPRAEEQALSLVRFLPHNGPNLGPLRDPGETGTIRAEVKHFSCEYCQTHYPSRNKLFKHLDETGHHTSSTTARKPISIFAAVAQPKIIVSQAQHPKIIVSNASPVAGTGMAFRTSNYLEIAIRATPSGQDNLVCLDTGCGMTCLDRKFASSQYPEALIQKISPIEIRGLGNKVHLSDEYAVLDIYLPGYIGKDNYLGKITREFHLVDNLPCKALIGNDIADVEGFEIDIKSRQCKIKSIDAMVCPLTITPRGRPVEHRMVRTSKDIILRRKAKTVIPVTAKKLPDDRDYRFQARFTPQTAHLAIHGSFPESILDSQSMFVTYYNTSRISIRLPANSHIGEISEWDSDERLGPPDPEVTNCLFAAVPSIPTIHETIMMNLSSHQIAQAFLRPGETYLPDPYVFLGLYAQELYSLLPPLDECGEPASRFGPEAVNINTTDDITPEEVQAFRDLVAEFPELWEDRVGRVIQPEEDWMQIPLKPGAVLDSKGRYRVSKRDEAAIDELFDKARADGRISAAEGVVPVGWPVFVVWKNGKARPVVDLRGLNEQTVMDAYPLQRPEDVTALSCLTLARLQATCLRSSLRSLRFARL